MNDTAVTAIVCPPPLKDRVQRPFEEPTPQTVRHAYHTDAASGIFSLWVVMH
jgi:hypothetical protein